MEKRRLLKERWDLLGSLVDNMLRAEDFENLSLIVKLREQALREIVNS